MERDTKLKKYVLMFCQKQKNKGKMYYFKAYSKYFFGTKHVKATMLRNHDQF